MNKWFTSDLHFGHKNILKFCPESRPYTSVEEMNEAILTNHNEVVQPDDEVWILGDVAFCQASQASQYVKRLNGRKHLIIGNHDTKLLKSVQFKSCFESIQDYAVIDVKHNDKKLKYVLFHFPIYEWDRQHHHARHLHGHTHGKVLTGMRGKFLDVGLDNQHFDGTYMRPFNVDEIEFMLAHKPAIPHGDSTQ